MSRSKSAHAAPDMPEPLALPTSGGSYVREADGTLTLVPDGPVGEPPPPPPSPDLTETPAEKEA